ncbi:hypothetical protein BTO06_07500 [Tenacibaculum sp. SZ-18]|uniref:FecR family protein n=1 Tax=Tenacibaculum sp. SZ-18 TaxID=754423 RepID=UPI000C2CF6CE|nr:FecR family protein [Tenacibaculum sp. SZ-18]AUC14990.1 hypothetical protein BTO06_07500 [Tenacibaculum sp. SZ-18]
MKKNKNYNTIQDFLEDASFNSWILNKSNEDSREWDNWLQENPKNKLLADEARDIIIGINFKKETVNDDKISLEWDKLSSRIQSLEVEKLEKDLQNQSSFIRIKFISIAASLLLLISLGIFTYSLFSKVTHKTNYGEMLNVILEDGSIVTLNVNSSISYSNYYPREIELTGEAFFNVKKDVSENSKFSVRTENLTVEVYGTQFNIKTSSDKTDVYLEEGNILLNLNNGKNQQMSPGNYIEYSSKKRKIIVNKEDSFNNNYASWKSGNLIFSNTSLNEALNRVSETYGVNFSYNNSETKDILITGKVPTTDLEICLNAIKKSTNVTIQKENGILVVYKN